MIAIPRKVKKKLKEYTGYKNLRVHFPNGENEDLTNENIVFETLELKESTCSKKTLEFGLCEANSIQFECVGVGNVKGAVIKVTLEIQTDDGEMYPIPYGVYKIDSCKRQSDFNRRKIIAYDAIKSKTLDSYIGEQINEEIRKTDYFRAPSIYQFEKNFFAEYGITRKPLQQQEVAWNEGTTAENTANSDTGGIYAYIHEYYLHYDLDPDLDPNEYYTFFNPEELQAGRAEKINTYLESRNFTFSNSRAYWLEHLCHVRLYDENRKFVDSTVNGEEYTNVKEITLMVTDAVEIRHGTQSNYTVLKSFDFGYQDAYDSVKVYQIALNDVEKMRITTEVAKTTARSLLSAVFELRGTFGRINREDGAIEDVELGNGSLYPADTLYPADDLYPAGSNETYRKGNYSIMTYDEFTTKPFNAIYANYRDENGEDSEITYTFAESGQTYKMTNNWILKNMNLTSTQVEEILIKMAAKIKDITYVPFNMKSVGLPYLEAGDMIEIVTEEGVIRSYILKRKISGIQMLEDSIQANGEE